MEIVKVKDWLKTKYSKHQYKFSNENQFPFWKKNETFSIEKIYVHEDEATYNTDFCCLTMDIKTESNNTNCISDGTVPKIYLTYNNQPSILLEIAKTVFRIEEIC